MKESRLVVFWHPFAEKSIYSGKNLFLTGESTQAGIIGVDLKDYRDTHAGRLIREADLTVIFLKHDLQILDAYFCFFPDRKERVLFCVYDYFEEADPTPGQMLHRYRIAPDRLCILPFNSRLEFADSVGHLPSYLNQEKRRLPYEQAIGFYPALRDAREKMWRALALIPPFPLRESA